MLISTRNNRKRCKKSIELSAEIWYNLIDDIIFT